MARRDDNIVPFFMKYQTLKVGDVRQEKDEVKREYAPESDKDWHFIPSTMYGHSILPSDLCHLSFRRPLL